LYIGPPSVTKENPVNGSEHIVNPSRDSLTDTPTLGGAEGVGVGVGSTVGVGVGDAVAVGVGVGVGATKGITRLLVQTPVDVTVILVAVSSNVFV
jgi:hypothetical protein